MLDFIFTALFCMWESLVFCFSNVPYVDYVVYFLLAVMLFKTYNFIFGRKRIKVIQPVKPEISKTEKLLEIWDDLDADEQEDYKSEMTDDEWLDFKYNLIKKCRTNKS